MVPLEHLPGRMDSPQALIAASAKICKCGKGQLVGVEIKWKRVKDKLSCITILRKNWGVHREYGPYVVKPLIVEFVGKRNNLDSQKTI